MNDFEYIGERLRGAASDCNIRLEQDQVRYITKAVLAAYEAVERRNKHTDAPYFGMPLPEQSSESLKYQLPSQNTLPGYCPDCGVSRIPPFLKRCSRCCDTEEKKTEQAEACERNKEFYGQSSKTLGDIK